MGVVYWGRGGAGARRRGGSARGSRRRDVPESVRERGARDEPPAAPHCVSVIDFGVEFTVPGDGLRDRADAARPMQGRLPAGRAVRLAQRALAGLAHAHEQEIVHRDLKPENLILSEEAGLKEHLRILDSRAGEASRQAGDDGGDGGQTAGYVAGRWARRAIDARTDLYAVGVVLFEMFTGRKPFQSRTSREVILMQPVAAAQARATAPEPKLFGRSGSDRQGDVKLRGRFSPAATAQSPRPTPAEGKAAPASRGKARCSTKSANLAAGGKSSKAPSPVAAVADEGRGKPAAPVMTVRRTPRRRSTVSSGRAGSKAPGDQRRRRGSSGWRGSARCSWSSRCWRCCSGAACGTAAMGPPPPLVRPRRPERRRRLPARPGQQARPTARSSSRRGKWSRAVRSNRRSCS